MIYHGHVDSAPPAWTNLDLRNSGAATIPGSQHCRRPTHSVLKLFKPGLVGTAPYSRGSEIETLYKHVTIPALNTPFLSWSCFTSASSSSLPSPATEEVTPWLYKCLDGGNLTMVIHSHPFPQKNLPKTQRISTSRLHETRNYGGKVWKADPSRRLHQDALQLHR